MEPYLKKFFFIETIVVLPKYLNAALFENLRLIITQKYSSKKYKNMGYIQNIQVDSILNNKITLSGQIVFEVKAKAYIYTPERGHIFQSKIHENSRYKWIKIGPLVIYIINNNLEQEEFNVNDESNLCRKVVAKIDDQMPGQSAVQITSVKLDNALCYGKIL